jgi:hypothetical protein
MNKLPDANTQEFEHIGDQDCVICLQRLVINSKEIAMFDLFIEQETSKIKILACNDKSK